VTIVVLGRWLKWSATDLAGRSNDGPVRPVSVDVAAWRRHEAENGARFPSLLLLPARKVSSATAVSGWEKRKP
jgi:hypothetical protein